MKIRFDEDFIVPNDSIIEMTRDETLFNDKFELGSTLCRTMKISIARDAVANYLRPVTVRIEEDDDTILFWFLVDTIDTSNDSYIVYNLVDDMVRLNQVYDWSGLANPTVNNILEEMVNNTCVYTGFEAGFLQDELYMGDVVVPFQKGLMARDFVSWVAEVNGGFARVQMKDFSGTQVSILEFVRYNKTETYDCDMETCSDYKIGGLHRPCEIVFEKNGVEYNSNVIETTEGPAPIEINNISGTKTVNGVGFKDSLPLITQTSGYTFANPRTVMPTNVLNYKTVGSQTYDQNVTISPSIWGGDVNLYGNEAISKWRKLKLENSSGNVVAKIYDTDGSVLHTLPVTFSVPESPYFGNYEHVRATLSLNDISEEYWPQYSDLTVEQRNYLSGVFSDLYWVSSADNRVICTGSDFCNAHTSQTYPTGMMFGFERRWDLINTNYPNNILINFFDVSSTMGLSDNDDTNGVKNYILQHPVEIYFLAEKKTSEHISFTWPTLYSPEEQFEITCLPKDSTGTATYSPSDLQIIQTVVNVEQDTNDYNVVTINPDNLLMTIDNDTYPIEDILNSILTNIVGMRFYSFKTDQCQTNANVKTGDIVNFIDSANGETYPMIAQIRWSYNMGWIGGYDTYFESDLQSETQVVSMSETIMTTLAKKQDLLTAGDGIEISSNNVISATSRAPVLLWTNSSPSSNFTAQTIPLDLSAYSCFLTICYRQTTMQDDISTFCTFHIKDVTSVCLGGAASPLRRAATFTDIGVTFGTGYNAGTAGTQFMIPYQIYGIK